MTSAAEIPAPDAAARDEGVAAVCRLAFLFRAVALLVTVFYIPQQSEVPALSVAFIAAAAASYLPLRHWDRIGPIIMRHPSYLAAELLLTVAILAVAGPQSPFFYFTLGTAFIAGVIYRIPGAVLFTALLLAAYYWTLDLRQAVDPVGDDFQNLVGLPVLYPLAAAAGVAIRLMLDRRARDEAELADARATASAERERIRLAREMHDSLAKTVEGIALQAAAISERLRGRAGADAAELEALSRDAGTATREARVLMQRLREGAGADRSQPFIETARSVLDEWSQRTAIEVRSRFESVWGLDPEDGGELLMILEEALRNVERHAGAGRVDVSARTDEGGTTIEVRDDGRGFAIGAAGAADANGHYGLVGMRERAEQLGGELAVESARGEGTTVRVTLPAERSQR